MLKKIISRISSNRIQETDNFFDLPDKEKKKIIRKAAKLSVLDQKKLLREYEHKFGDLHAACENTK